MDRVIIFGTSAFSAVLYQTIVRESQAEVVAFTLSKSYCTEDSFEGLPIVPFEELTEYFDMAEIKIALSLGYKKMNDNRKSVFEICKKAGFHLYTFVSRNACMYSSRIGEGSIILPGAFVGPYVTVGKAVIIWNMASICHHSTIGDYSFISAGSVIGGNTDIGTNCFIGLNSTVKNGIIVGNRTFIGAACYVNHDTESGRGYRGNPAVNDRNVLSDVLIELVS